MLDMLKEYFVNASILISFTSIIHLGFLSTGLKQSLTLARKIALGTVLGLMGILLMLFSIRLPSLTMLDFRYLAIVIAGVYSSFIPTLIAGVIISLARLLIFQHSLSSVVGMILVLSVTLVACILTQTKLSEKKSWVIGALSAFLLAITAYIIVIPDRQLLIKVIISYFVSFLAVSLLMYVYINYLKNTTDSFRQCNIDATKDHLTGLNNVRHFDLVFNKMLAQTQSREENLALIYLDIDHFKLVNDTYGHQEGDLVLSRLGGILMNSCRTIDIVSRNGGEEFSVILSECDQAMALEIAERIRKQVENTVIMLTNNVELHITVSLGVACYPDPIQDIGRLRERADEALYAAKRAGRNRVMVAKL